MGRPGAARKVGLAAVLAACAIAGCESSDDAGSGAAAAGDAPAAEVRAVLERVQRAFFAGDGETVCAGLTDRVREELAAGGNLGCAAAFDQASARDRTGAPGDPIARVLRVEVDGDRAVALVTIGGDRSRVPLVEEGGDWKVNGGFGTDR